VSKRAKRRRKPPLAERKRPATLAQVPDGGTPAFLEPGKEAVEADADPSVEDPLQDWPELEAEKDEWLLERDGEGNEPPDR